MTPERRRGPAGAPIPSWVCPPGSDAVANGDHGDPFAILGPHTDPASGTCVVRSLNPDAESVEVVSRDPAIAPVALTRVHDAGLFSGIVPAAALAAGYRLRLSSGGHVHEIDDPYRFPPLLSDLDIYLLAEGTHLRAYDALGAHVSEQDGVAGTRFAVWAPNARRVSVVGDFNAWDGRRYPMRLRPECGIWEIFLPGVSAGALYKYEIKTQAGEILLKADPFAFAAEHPPATASRVVGPTPFAWGDAEWMARRGKANDRASPMAVYEVHLGSWRRKGHPWGEWLSYRELARELVDYVADMGFTHIELMPVTEFPFDGSWGYQPSGLFAPTSRFGAPDDFRAFVDACHARDIGVILDWVPGHFPSDEHGLARFDGTCLYEHEDERLGRHKDWDTLIYNYGRREVTNFLIASALFWLREFHIDGLRVDAVASMLYLDYSRQPGEWIPNVYGGNENLDAIAFLRRLNAAVYAETPGAVTIAEESTSWPMVSRPVHDGGLGFGYKWNMGWMNDMLRYIRRDPIHRSYHHDDITFGMLYAWTENFILPLAHDEVVHGKGSLLGKMPGDRWQQFANLRLYLAYMYTYPGKKLVFMGSELAQQAEWNHDRAIDWEALADPMHRGAQGLVRDLNRIYATVPALHARDCESGGFRWIDCGDAAQNVVTFIRYGGDGSQAVVACNFSPVVHHGYRVGVPDAGLYRECFNSDAREYGGSGVGNSGAVASEPVPWHGFPHSLALTLPPLAAVILLAPGTPDPGGTRGR